MTDFQRLDQVSDLLDHLLSAMPELQVWLDKACDEWEEGPQSQYWLFSFVVRPFLENARNSGDNRQLAHAWNVLDSIASASSAATQNELAVMLEELDLWDHYEFMGPCTRDMWFTAIAWYPKHQTGNQRINDHVDENRYRQRWAEEISRLGGFERLTTDHQIQIGAMLWREFGIDNVQLYPDA